MTGSCRLLNYLNLLFGLCLAFSPDAHSKSNRPNVLVLMTDDQRWDCLSCMGHPVLQTPHIDRLAAEGVIFTNAFVTTAICSVSRASFITGRYNRNHGVGDFNTALRLKILAASYPAVLKKAGYRTGCLGKWGIGGPAPEGVFDYWHATGGQGEFFETIHGKQVHNSELLTRQTEEFLRSGGPEQPFCLLVCYKSPHEPYLPDPADTNLFRDVTFPIPKTYSPSHFNALPEFIRKSEGRIRLEKGHPTPEKYQEFVRQYLRCLAGVDRSVGKILHLLDELELAGNTIVVFTSDNGFFLGEHGLSGKWLMHEESIRVPLIIRYPKLPARMKGRRLGKMALNIDLSPTLLELAGLAIPAGTDGRSLKPLLTGERLDWRQDFFYEHHFDYGGRIPRTEGLRTADWKYITYFDVEPPLEELYDLRHDPLEETNLASDPRYSDRLATLRTGYQKYVRGFGPPVRPTPPPFGPRGREK